MPSERVSECFKVKVDYYLLFILNWVDFLKLVWKIIKLYYIY